MAPGRISTRVKRIPPFTNPRVRKAVIDRRAQLGRSRRRLAERLGSDRWSHPALYEMDRKLEAHLPHDSGFFVEAGANDGYLQSNTYYFERFKKWTGVLVEPVPELYRACRRERPGSAVFNCALVPDERAGEPVRMHYGGLMSVMAGIHETPTEDRAHAEAGSQLGWDLNYELEVPGRTLTSILDEVGATSVDLISLDVEGYEASALEGLDVERFAPSMVLVEVRDQGNIPAIEAALGPAYEVIADLSPLDVLYARRS
jgi:FkbM family methyltransferase